MGRCEKWCKKCQKKYFKENFANWTSGNDRINKFIQRMQLNINNCEDIIFEWIPYSQFYSVKKIYKCESSKIYSAKWKNGPLSWYILNTKYVRYSNEKVVILKYLHTSPGNITNGFLSDIYKEDKHSPIYGISQNPDTEDYIMVLGIEYYCVGCGKLYTHGYEKWCKQCQVNNFKKRFSNWTSGNEKIDEFIQVMQLNINNYKDIIFEWIPYNQFRIIKEIGKCDFATIYSAEWKDGHLFWYKLNKEYTRNSYERVVLECLHTSHNNITNEFLNEIYEENKHSLRYGRLMYGISQNPNTKQYTLIFNEEYTFFDDNDKHLEYLKKFCLKCGKLYTNIQHKWCKSCRINDLEKNFANWTSGNENNIVVVNKSSFTIVYSAIWNDGPIYYNQDERTSLNKLVALISLNNSQNITDEFLNKIQNCSNENRYIFNIYGISQNPDMKDYMMVLDYTYFEYYCARCNQKYTNKELKLYILFEWISYNQFNSIKEEGKSSFATMYSAIWKDGPMFYNQNERKNLNKKVALMSLSNSQNIVDEFLKEDQNYLKEKCYINKSSNIIEIHVKINDLKENFNDWSENEKVDSFIQKLRLEVFDYKGILFEWIPYNQFKSVKEIGKGGFAIVYSAIWKDGPICYNQNERKNLNKLVALKSLSNSHNISNEFLKEVQNYSREMRYTSKSSNILKIYGMSQNPNTKNYIMVLEYANGGNFDKYWIKKNYTTFNWDRRIISLYDIIKGLMEIHQKHTIHCDFHTGNILYDFLQRKVYISDMGLCREVNNTDKTKIYGVMPYVAPEILRGKSYTQAADIYSFGMIMYFMATGRQPFDNRAHDYDLALDMCKGIRPDINEPEAPEFYINLMKRCWDSNPDKRPNVVELEKEINSYTKYKIKSKFREAEEYRKANFSSFKDNLSATHSHAIYTSRLLNPFTKDLPKYDDDQELSSKITVYNKEDNEVDYNNTSESLENCKI
ncbi:hypothetical protein RclHR1_00290007 [Rhizophagus clarus]|uniref:Protein kinase domain-containing protein n=1 Tax=Rhizophagus clarus TaxID=94130 RepID=A0A2Z6RI90_9GLOM|nr:hypothetical protein RclHR1_00290007 [Rhizophagus clarus]